MRQVSIAIGFAVLGCSGGDWGEPGDNGTIDPQGSQEAEAPEAAEVVVDDGSTLDGDSSLRSVQQAVNGSGGPGGGGQCTVACIKFSQLPLGGECCSCNGEQGVFVQGPYPRTWLCDTD